jgi:hypothetical protein
MPLTLECHIDNDDGLGFWQSRGYRFQEDVVVAEGGEPVRPYHRMVR